MSPQVSGLVTQVFEMIPSRSRHLRTLSLSAAAQKYARQESYVADSIMPVLEIKAVVKLPCHRVCKIRNVEGNRPRPVQ